MAPSKVDSPFSRKPAGRVQKPNFSKLKLDLKGVYYISKIIKKSRLGDAALLKEIINIFKKERIQTVSSTTFTPELNLSKGNYSKLKPNLKDKIDIKNALKVLNKSNQYSHIQGAISRNNIAILEKREGTQKMLKKIKKIKNITNGVLVKFPKKKQDLRVDLPSPLRVAHEFAVLRLDSLQLFLLVCLEPNHITSIFIVLHNILFLRIYRTLMNHSSYHWLYHCINHSCKLYSY